MHDWVERLNRYGRERRPCIFLIDYELSNSLVVPLDDLDSALVRFDFRGHRNFTQRNESVDEAEVATSKLPIAGVVRGPPPVLPGITGCFPSSYRDYRRAFLAAQTAFRDGNSYLLNLSASTVVQLAGSLNDVFDAVQAPYRLRVSQAAAASEFIVFSPECFVRIEGRVIQTFPMKGSLRCRIDELEPAKKQLLDNAKELAEHVTIVDLMRNDLGRVSEKVSVPRFRFMEEIRMADHVLLQTSSEVTGELPPDWRTKLGSIFAELLPAGSISGAPKKKTLQHIAEAEALLGQTRGWYTGVCGIFDGENLDSAVMIRFLEKTADGRTVFKSGGGLTVYSKPQAEYRELLDKIALPIPPRLIETIRLENNAAWNVQAHQARVHRAATQCYGRDAIWNLDALLSEALARVTDAKRWRCRIVYTADSAWWTVEPYVVRRPDTLVLVDVGTMEYSHKYEDRTKLDALLRQTDIGASKLTGPAQSETTDILLHRNGVLLEARYAAIVVEMDGKLVTPFDAMLPSTRIAELESHNLVERKSLRIEDLAHAKSLRLVNAMIGLEDEVRIRRVIDPTSGREYRFAAHGSHA